jgi:hypothetical protein
MLVLKVSKGYFDINALRTRYYGCTVTLKNEGNNTLIMVEGLKVRLNVDAEIYFVETCRIPPLPQQGLVHGCHEQPAPIRREQPTPTHHGHHEQPTPTHHGHREQPAPTHHGHRVQPTPTHHGHRVQPTPTHHGHRVQPTPTHHGHREQPAPTHHGHHEQPTPTSRQGPMLSQGAWSCPKSNKYA